MKKYTRFLVLLLALSVSSLPQKISGMERLVAAAVQGAASAVTTLLARGTGGSAETVVKKSEWQPRLDEQNYAALWSDFEGLLKESADPGQRLATQAWIVDHLKSRLDPFLLYIDASSVLKGSAIDGDTYQRVLSNFALSVIMADVAHQVLERLCSRGDIPDVGDFFKRKFLAKYGAGSFSLAIRGMITFESLRPGIIARLQALQEKSALDADYPLPHWILKTALGRYGGATWGIGWGSLDEAEKAVRTDEAIGVAVVALTQKALENYIKALGSIATWDAFFEMNGSVAAAGSTK